MFNYLMRIEYDGTKFVGWQYQKNGNSIQGVLQNAFSKFLKEKVIVTGAGRTDAGVHAVEQTAHIELKKKIKDKDVFLNSINFYLKKHPISVTKIKIKNKNFHARFSAKKRAYRYVIVNRIASLVLDEKRAWHVRKKLNVKLMEKGIKLLKGTHDFSTFRAAACGAKSPVKTIENAQIKKNKEKIIITFISKSFLQHQVRSMVGCLKLLGENKWNIQDFKNAFFSKKRSNCATLAPPHGLFLLKIYYNI